MGPVAVRLAAGAVGGDVQHSHAGSLEPEGIAELVVHVILFTLLGDGGHGLGCGFV